MHKGLLPIVGGALAGLGRGLQRDIEARDRMREQELQRIWQQRIMDMQFQNQRQLEQMRFQNQAALEDLRFGRQAQLEKLRSDIRVQEEARKPDAVIGFSEVPGGAMLVFRSGTTKMVPFDSEDPVIKYMNDEEGNVIGLTKGGKAIKTGVKAPVEREANRVVSTTKFDKGVIITFADGTVKLVNAPKEMVREEGKPVQIIQGSDGKYYAVTDDLKTIDLGLPAKQEKRAKVVSTIKFDRGVIITLEDGSTKFVKAPDDLVKGDEGDDVELIQGADGKYYAVKDDLTVIDLGLPAKKDKEKVVVEKFQNGLAIVTPDGQIRWATIPENMRRDEITDVVVADDGKYYGITKGGKRVELGIDAPKKQEQRFAAMARFDNAVAVVDKDGNVKWAPLPEGFRRRDVADVVVGEDGSYYAIMKDGTEVKLTVRARKEEQRNVQGWSVIGNAIAVVGRDGSVKFVPVPEEMRDKGISRVVVGKDGFYYAVGKDGSQRRLDIQAPEEPQKPVIGWSRFENAVAIIDNKGDVRFVPLPEDLRRESITRVIVGEDRSYYAVREDGSLVKLPVKAEQKDRAKIFATAKFGQSLAVVGSDGKVRFVPVPDQLRQESVRSVVVSDDGFYYIITEDGRQVKTDIRAPRKDKRKVFSVSTTPSAIAITMSDGTVKFEPIPKRFLDRDFQKFIIGDDGYFYGIDASGETVKLGVKAPQGAVKVTRTITDENGNIVLVMDDGTTVQTGVRSFRVVEQAARQRELDIRERQLEEQARQNELRAQERRFQEFIIGQDGNVYGIDDRGDVVDLGIKAPSKQARVLRTVTDQDGNFVLILDDGNVINTGIKSFRVVEQGLKEREQQLAEREFEAEQKRAEQQPQVSPQGVLQQSRALQVAYETAVKMATKVDPQTGVQSVDWDVVAEILRQRGFGAEAEQIIRVNRDREMRAAALSLAEQEAERLDTWLPNWWEFPGGRLTWIERRARENYNALVRGDEPPSALTLRRGEPASVPAETAEPQAAGAAEAEIRPPAPRPELEGKVFRRKADGTFWQQVDGVVTRRRDLEKER